MFERGLFSKFYGILFSFLFIWNWIDKYVYTLPWFPGKPYPIPDQNGQSVYPFSDKKAQEPYPLGRDTPIWLI